MPSRTADPEEFEPGPGPAKRLWTRLVGPRPPDRPAGVVAISWLHRLGSLAGFLVALAGWVAA